MVVDQPGFSDPGGEHREGSGRHESLRIDALGVFDTGQLLRLEAAAKHPQQLVRPALPVRISAGRQAQRRAQEGDHLGGRVVRDLQPDGAAALAPAQLLLDRLQEIVGLVLVYTTMFVLINVLIDILYAVIDPRVRFD